MFVFCSVSCFFHRIVWSFFCGNLERGLDYQLFLQHASSLIIIPSSLTTDETFAKQWTMWQPSLDIGNSIQIKFTLIDCSYQSWKVTLSPYDTEAQSPAWILILFSGELQITLFRSVHTDKILRQVSHSKVYTIHIKGSFKVYTSNCLSLHSVYTAKEVH